MTRRSVPSDLPSPATMSLEDLRAEVEGGRIAYATLVEENRALRRRVRDLKGQVRSAFSPTTVALWKQDAERETVARIVALFRDGADELNGDVRDKIPGIRCGDMAEAIERGDWRKR